MGLGGKMLNHIPISLSTPLFGILKALSVCLSVAPPKITIFYKTLKKLTKTLQDITEPIRSSRKLQKPVGLSLTESLSN